MVQEVPWVLVELMYVLLFISGMSYHCYFVFGRLHWVCLIKPCAFTGCTWTSRRYRSNGRQWREGGCCHLYSQCNSYTGSKLICFQWETISNCHDLHYLNLESSGIVSSSHVFQCHQVMSWCIIILYLELILLMLILFHSLQGETGEAGNPGPSGETGIGVCGCLWVWSRKSSK